MSADKYPSVISEKMHGGYCLYILRGELEEINRLSKNLNRVFVSGKLNGTRPELSKKHNKTLSIIRRRNLNSKCFCARGICASRHFRIVF